MIKMADLVAEGAATPQELQRSLLRFAERIRDAYDEPSPGDDEDGDELPWGADCPAGCEVCAEAKPQFDAIREESAVHKRRLDDPEQFPYAAGKHTLHRSVCRKAREAVGGIEDDDSPWYTYGLRQFAHHGVRNTGWASLMAVLTVSEAADWIRARTGPRGGTRYRVCRLCQPALP